MIKLDNLIQLKAFARQDGALLSLLWTASFAAVIYAPQTPLGNILALATPFFIGWRLASFRNYALNGVISFRRGFAYSVFTTFYASAIFAIMQYLYFMFLDNNMFMTMITKTMNDIMPIYAENGFPVEELNNELKMMAELTPIQWAFMFMMQNIFIGLILAFPIAAVCSRRAGRKIKINN